MKITSLLACAFAASLLGCGGDASSRTPSDGPLYNPRTMGSSSPGDASAASSDPPQSSAPSSSGVKK